MPRLHSGVRANAEADVSSGIYVRVRREAWCSVLIEECTYDELREYLKLKDQASLIQLMIVVLDKAKAGELR